MYAQPSPEFTRTILRWRKVRKAAFGQPDERERISRRDKFRHPFYKQSRQSPGGFQQSNQLGWIPVAIGAASTAYSLWGGSLFGGGSKAESQAKKAGESAQIATRFLSRLAKNPDLVVKFIEDPNSTFPNCTKESVAGRSCFYVLFALAADAGCPTHVPPGSDPYSTVYNYPGGWFFKRKKGEKGFDVTTGKYIACLRSKLPEIQAIIAMAPPMDTTVAVQPVQTTMPVTMPSAAIPSTVPITTTSCPFGFALDKPSGYCLPVDTGQMPITYTDPVTGEQIAPPDKLTFQEAGLGGIGTMAIFGGGLLLLALAFGQKPKRQVRRQRKR